MSIKGLKLNIYRHKFGVFLGFTPEGKKGGVELKIEENISVEGS